MHLFSAYKDLDPERSSTVHAWSERGAALREIEECTQRYERAPAFRDGLAG